MAENRKCFTFIWKIKNFSLSRSKAEFFSPSFFVRGIAEAHWNLYLFPNAASYQNCVACYFHRETSYGLEAYEWDYELSLLSADGSVLQSETYHKRVFLKDSFGQPTLHVKRNEVFLHKKDLFIPDDTLTIRCRMWDVRELFLLPGKCFAETRFETKMNSLVGTIVKLSYVETGQKYPICFKNSTDFSANLSVTASGLLNFEIKSTDNHIFKIGKIFILDILKNKVTSNQSEIYFADSFCIPLPLSKDSLIRNKENFLPNDELTICCEIIEDAGTKSDQIEYIFDSDDAPGVITNSKRMDQACEESQDGNIPTLKDDLISLFSDSTFSDSKLKTATETFPVHVAILSARSPVFKSMFATDMKEKTNNCVEIDDLDADTVRRMLLFIYSDTLDDLEYESAKSLYFAADKYNIALLKQRCSDFLKQKLLDSNCCDILLLADQHQDTDLINAVQDFIAKNSEAVLFSDEWKNMEKSHPHLTAEVFRFIYMKMRRN